MEMSIREVKQRIYSVREYQVVLDNDLAEFYQTKTKILNQAVLRNLNRFPADFRFRLTQKEHSNLNSQSRTVQEGGKEETRGGRKYLPYAFTQEGIAMLSSVLKSDRAVQVNIVIMRAFVQLRQVSETHLDLIKRFEQLEQKVSNAIRLPVAPGPAYLTTASLTSYYHADSRHLSVALQHPVQALQIEDLSRDPQQLSRATVGKENRTKISAIHQAVAQYFGLRTQDLKATSRTKEVVLPRQIAIYLVREHTGIGFKEIGRIFGRKNHTTILHACRKISAAVQTDALVREAVEAIQQSLINLPTPNTGR